jgi:hypothetical protein
MAGVSRWVAGLSRKKQAALVILALWITSVSLTQLGVPPFADSKQAAAKPKASKPQARPAAVRWGGITKAEAIAQSYRDEFYADSHIAVPILFSNRGQFDRALSGGLMQGPSARRARCKGAQVWYVTYRSSTFPTAWFESKERGDNAFVCADVGASDSMTVRHR